ncbi:gamma-glutamylcyclotransferase family protein [Inhella gelatinilytica]|uniref:Gamma-glutamylcyclotransferase family protein n=1 Tax=Inhella gelatinilytica TaxID=2795030 RepID=A0A931IYD9_9BURK|nr:gamma-glutamylcyclotransferase family protein [Inhella gelatinilytica]MBH9552883.1 gamma-glutamylcyclotransferase [Inhella gelatinilytica]
MQHLIFVYGTLKQGFRNHPVNQGERVAGEFTTVQPLPLYIVGPRYLPWLVNQPGEGYPVHGELYEVNDEGLARMDELEALHLPDWYVREPVQVREPSGRLWSCQVYFGSASRLQLDAVHAGPLPAYTQEHAEQRVAALRGAGLL